jgi:ADP-heptose:LPS heptosyltransferase
MKPRPQVNKILFITLSNIGDAILTLPVLDTLKRRYPHSEVTVLVGPRPKEIFQDNPAIDTLIIYDKHSKINEKIRLFKELKEKNFDMVVDLRNSFLGLLLFWPSPET